MSTQHGGIFGQNHPNDLSEGEMHQNRSFARNPHPFGMPPKPLNHSLFSHWSCLGHRNRSLLEYQFHDSRSDYTRSSNSSIFSRSSHLSSMSSLPSSIQSSSQPSLLMPNISSPSPLKIISRERPTEGLYFCPICIQFKDDQPIVYMKRKGEMKSHIQRHITDELYHCDHCHTARDRFEDLKTHCKRAHGRPLRSTAMVGKIEQLMPQELFACGFLDWTGISYCREVRTSHKNWLDHIAEHMEGGSTPSEWSYSAVIRNLLRQPELYQLWKDHRYMCEGRDKRAWTRLSWDVDGSRTLMLKLNRRDFRPAVNTLLAWAYELGLPADPPVGQPADPNAGTSHQIPTLKPPNRNDVYGLSMIEIDTVLKRRSNISQETQAFSVNHDSNTMPHIEPVLDFITDHVPDLPDIPQMQLQPESNTESWPNLQLESSLHSPSDHNHSIFGLPHTTTLPYQPQSFHHTTNLPLDAGHPAREANESMGPDSHMLDSDTHNHTDFGYGIFHTSTDYHGVAP